MRLSSLPLYTAPQAVSDAFALINDPELAATVPASRRFMAWRIAMQAHGITARQLTGMPTGRPR